MVKNNENKVEDVSELAQESSKEKTNSLGKLRENPWMVSTFVFVIASVVLLIVMLSGNSVTGNVVSESDIGAQAVDFINNQLLQGQGTVSLVSVSEEANLYKVLVDYSGQQVPAYFTKDGQYFVGTQLVPLTGNAVNTQDTETQTPEEIPKSDKPVLDLFVFTYCPYGTQSEKGLIPVYNLLKNKVDFNIKFIGAMHGAHEQTESYRQLCIQKIYGKDKLFSYIDKFVASSAIGSCNGVETCSDPLVEAIMSQLGIDKNQVNTCMKNDAKELYDAEVANAEALGVSGSPTFIINGVQSSNGRNPAAILTAVCSAFNTAPSECSQTLSSTNPSAGFGSSTSDSSASSASCG